jgi:hypothetical protein
MKAAQAVQIWLLNSFLINLKECKDSQILGGICGCVANNKVPTFYGVNCAIV